MLGRLISGFASDRFGDRKLIRMGIAVELLGILQEALGIGIMPVYLLIFALLNMAFLELAYKRIAEKSVSGSCFRVSLRHSGMLFH
ncbi:MAG: hypothetical protein IJU93_01345 [Lachnospiraceae bacterium]|nr:hypothetical protein [Lachnospiraceae bacterium]